MSVFRLEYAEPRVGLTRGVLLTDGLRQLRIKLGKRQRAVLVVVELRHGCGAQQIRPRSGGRSF